MKAGLDGDLAGFPFGVDDHLENHFPGDPFLLGVASE